MPESPEFQRINRLFFEKLLKQYPDHPWRNRAPLPTWEQPRRVDQWWWMDLNIWSAPGIMRRYGRVSWNQDGTGYYDISINDEEHGWGFPCWPSYRALSDAQDEVERLLRLPFEELKEENGRTEWRDVVK
jgi:hypothetical protein